ncbi:hypothetical protein F5X98DRAFT_220931 [Xylaria grammica]|nr:hypothetical protein F5X98DRAFT_220931 [Xylaria grammica]
MTSGLTAFFSLSLVDAGIPILSLATPLTHPMTCHTPPPFPSHPRVPVRRGCGSCGVGVGVGVVRRGGFSLTLHDGTC